MVDRTQLNFSWSCSYRRCWASCSTWLDGPTDGSQTTPPCLRPEDGSSPLEGRRRSVPLVCIWGKDTRVSKIAYQLHKFCPKSNTWEQQEKFEQLSRNPKPQLSLWHWFVSRGLSVSVDVLQLNEWTWLPPSQVIWFNTLAVEHLNQRRVVCLLVPVWFCNLSIVPPTGRQMSHNFIFTSLFSVFPRNTRTLKEELCVLLGNTNNAGL